MKGKPHDISPLTTEAYPSNIKVTKSFSTRAYSKTATIAPRIPSTAYAATPFCTLSPPLWAILEAMLTKLLSIEPPETVVVTLCVIVAVAEVPVSVLDTLTLAIVWEPDWKTAPAVIIPSEVAKSEEATACFSETHSSVWRPI
jgi:hypothetical protein